MPHPTSIEAAAQAHAQQVHDNRKAIWQHLQDLYPGRSMQMSTEEIPIKVTIWLQWWHWLRIFGSPSWQASMIRQDVLNAYGCLVEVRFKAVWR